VLPRQPHVGEFSNFIVRARMWDAPVITDRTAPANRPDGVLHDIKEETYLLIDMGVSDDSKCKRKEIEKINK